MLAATYRINTADGHSIFVRHWHNEQKNVRGLIHILHGMAEHSARYARFAEILVNEGFEVIAHDHRGHGESAGTAADLGHYADAHGWEKVVNDVLIVQQHALAKRPELPLILFAHSMGSFIGQGFALKHSDKLAGLIISGSNYNTPAIYRILRQVARLERIRLGKRGRSKLLDYLSFGSFNSKFKPVRTAFDWLSRDPVEVDKYVNDPLCGFICTTQTWVELCKGLEEISTLKNMNRINKNLPVFLFYGENDPVSGKKHSVEILRKNLQQAGVTSVSCRMYSNGRHEMLNEINRDEVFDDVLHWLNTQFARTEKKLSHA